MENPLYFWTSYHLNVKGKEEEYVFDSLQIGEVGRKLDHRSRGEYEYRNEITWLTDLHYMELQDEGFVGNLIEELDLDTVSELKLSQADPTQSENVCCGFPS